MKLGWFKQFLDIILPPRESERLVRTLSLRELQEYLYGSPDGTLPYSEKTVKALVWELKYHKNERAAALAGNLLAENLLALAAEELGKVLLIPIPMHAKRRRERGHNQTELLCEAALSYMRRDTMFRGNSLVEPEGRPEDFSGKHRVEEMFEYTPNALERVRDTAPQQGLPKHIRLNNVKNSMATTGPDAGRIAGRVCVVVDDVTTTGATFAEAKRALRGAGARAVHCLALAQS